MLKRKYCSSIAAPLPPITSRPRSPPLSLACVPLVSGTSGSHSCEAVQGIPGTCSEIGLDQAGTALEAAMGKAGAICLLPPPIPACVVLRQALHFALARRRVRMGTRIARRWPSLNYEHNGRGADRHGWVFEYQGRC